MAGEIDVYDGGDIAPYNPGQPLAPLQPDTWGATDVDLLREDHSYHQSGPTLFGAAMPAGTTPQAVQAVLGEIAGTYLSDFTKLNFPPTLTQSAISFFMANATKPARQVTPQHRFNLPNELANDWLAVLFANHLQGLGGTQQQKQQFLNASLAWIDKLNKRLNSQQLGENQGKPMPRMAPQTSDPTADLTDAEYERVVKINDAAKAQTYGYLESLWGQSFKSNLRMVDAYYAALPQHEQAALDVFTTGWVKALNTKEIILGLYKQAIGSNSLPSGGAVATEIAEHEHVMKTDRKRWMADERLQARYRELITLRDGR